MFSSVCRLDETQRMYGANVILFEGIMTFHSPELRDLMDLKIFVDTDSDIRLARRCMRVRSVYMDRVALIALHYTRLWDLRRMPRACFFFFYKWK